MSNPDFATHRAQLLRFVTGITGNAEFTEDIVQETLLRAHKAAATFSDQAQPATWLAAIALNVIRDHYRTRARKHAEIEDAETLLDKLPADGDDTVLSMMKGEMGACSTDHLVALPERQRRALILHDMMGASHAEMAATLGIGEGNARTILHRARAALRERLQCHCHLDFGGDVIPCTPRTVSI